MRCWSLLGFKGLSTHNNCSQKNVTNIWHLFCNNTSLQACSRSKRNQWNTIIITELGHLDDLFSVSWPHNKICRMTFVVWFIFPMLFPYNHCRWNIFSTYYLLKGSSYVIIDACITNLWVKYYSLTLKKIGCLQNSVWFNIMLGLKIYWPFFKYGFPLFRYALWFWRRRVQIVWL